MIVVMIVNENNFVILMAASINITQNGHMAIVTLMLAIEIVSTLVPEIKMIEETESAAARRMIEIWSVRESVRETEVETETEIEIEGEIVTMTPDETTDTGASTTATEREVVMTVVDMRTDRMTVAWATETETEQIRDL